MNEWILLFSGSSAHRNKQKDRQTNANYIYKLQLTTAHKFRSSSIVIEFYRVAHILSFYSLVKTKSCCFHSNFSLDYSLVNLPVCSPAHQWHDAGSGKGNGRGCVMAVDGERVGVDAPVLYCTYTPRLHREYYQNCFILPKCYLFNGHN